MTRYVLSLCILIVWFGTALGQGTPISNSEILGREAGAIGKTKITVVDAVIHGFVNAKVPGGVVRIVKCNRTDPEATANGAVSLKGLLDLLKLKGPEYDWHVDRGVVNVIPNTGFPVPVDIPISDFHVKDVTALEAFNQLVNRPDLKAALGTRGLFQGLELDGGGFPISKARITLDLKNVSLLEVLNSIVREDGRAVWGYTLNPCQGRNL